MKKKHLPLALLCALTMTTPAEAASQSEVEQVITTLSIMAGDAKGNLNLGNTINRAEFTTMTVNVKVGDGQVAKPSTSPYPDVSRDHWSSAYVFYGVNNGLISGYSDGTFRPANQITLGEASVIIPNLLGYSSADFQGFSMDSRVSWMASAGLMDGVDAQTANTAITRKDTMYLFYNALTTPMKSGGTLLQTMGYTLSSDGEIDRTALIKAAMEGPLVATDDWEDQLPFDLSAVNEVNIDGREGDLKDIRNNDLVYYIANTKSLWVYQDRLTGVIEAINTSGATTSVTIAGKTFNAESEKAKFDLSTLGTFKKGDIVTALLGKDDGVAMVISPEYGTGMVVGVVTEVGTALYTDSVGGTYQGASITVLATDGSSSTYPIEASSNIVEGAIIEVTMDSNNKVTLTKGSSGQVNGVVSEDGTTMGNYTLASNIQILDVYDTTGTEIFPSRLAGLTISKSDVAYSRTNIRGEIDRLVLKDVTGEMHTYGYLRSLETSEATGIYVATYDAVLGQQGESTFTLGKRHVVSRGGFYYKGSVKDPDSMENLKSIDVIQVDSGSVTATGRIHPLAQNIVVIEKQSGNYYLSTINRLQETQYETITAYYVSNNDPHIRVILAE